MTRPFTLIAAVLFTLAALLHLYRIFTHFQIVAGSHTAPDWISYIAVVVAAVMAWGLYRESRT
jgi:protein-S-isoprenylcysteine O-methyltransferase Ste14